MDGTAEPGFAAFRDALFQPGRGLYLAPIRHHSPACAHAVRAMIREVRPAVVAIEAPGDFEDNLGLLTDPGTKPPVALVAMLEAGEGRRVAAYYPFCDHSPEYVAIQVAAEVGAQVRFMDLPAADKAHVRGAQADAPLALAEDRHFDGNAYVAALCDRTGCRDGFELWDHLFEARFGEEDWRGFFADVGVYCAGLREAMGAEEIAASGDAAREARMSTVLGEALAGGGPVVAVMGGFHAPALTDPQVAEVPAAKASEAWLVRYSFAALDALGGYAAGMPQPGYYDRVWRAEDLEDLPGDLLNGFAREMRAAGHPVGLPAQVEALRLARGLAQLKGRARPGRHDLFDGVRMALSGGEQGGGVAWTERLARHLTGTALGDVPPAAGLPPLVEDVRRRARALRIDVSDGAERRRKLDIRRRDTHLAASRLFHGLDLLDVPFARREIGPDYMARQRMDLLFEEWVHAWSPATEGRLIELSVHGDSLPAALRGHLMRERARLEDEGHGRDLGRLTAMLLRGVLAGMGAELTPFVAALERDVAAHGDFAAVATALRHLVNIVEATGPLAAEDGVPLEPLIGTAFRRLVHLCDELPKTPPEEITARLDALRLMNELLRGDEGGRFEAEPFDAAVERVVRPGTPPEILGAALAVSHISGRGPGDRLATALKGQFAGAHVAPVARIGLLRGVLTTAPALLWREAGLVGVVDGFLAELDETDFLTLLPHLRLAFTTLNPRETDRLAGLLAAHLGVQGDSLSLVATDVSEAEMLRGAAIEARLAAAVEADGLDGWLSGEVAP